MWLIDSEVVERNICLLCHNEHTCSESKQRGVTPIACGYMIAIDDAPTIEAKPVRHGKWIEETEPDENGNVVSMCNQCYHTVEHCKNIKVRYCWYCGAYMMEMNEDV